MIRRSHSSVILRVSWRKQFVEPLTLCLVIGFFNTGCALFDRSKSVDQAQQTEKADELQSSFERATDLLDKERFEEARDLLESLIQEKPLTDLNLFILFNLAAAYEGLGDCKRSGQKYREVIALTYQRPSQLFAQSLLRLSYAYECVGATGLAISTLKKLEKLDASLLPLAVLKAEVPARLAAYYAQIGQSKEAMRYFQTADLGIIELQKTMQKRVDLIDQITRAYYLMGRVADRKGKPIQANAYFEALYYQQTFLLRAAELSNNKWSALASEEMVAAYDRIEGLIQRELSQKQNSSARTQRLIQREWIEKSVIGIEKLKALKLPNEQSLEPVEKAFASLDVRLKAFQSKLTSLAVDTEMTSEALKLDAIKKEVR